MHLLSVPERLSGFTAVGSSVAALTSWGVGGTPGALITPRNQLEAEESIRWLRSEGVSFEVLGGGSNVLIADGVLPLTLLHTGALTGWEISVQGCYVFIRCDAGVALRSLFSLAFESSWSGLEFAVGIPGTVGGAIWGNAGTGGGNVSSIVSEVWTAEPDGSARRWDTSEIGWDYRKCALAEEKGRVLLSATLKLVASSRESVIERARAAAGGRKAQPKKVKTAGCVFKNPPGDTAGRLLDAGGCKIFSVGGARVAAAHANFIENYAGASAEDILTLALLCRKRVFEYFGIMLEFEIKFFGIPAERLR